MTDKKDASSKSFELIIKVIDEQTNKPVNKIVPIEIKRVKVKNLHEVTRAFTPFIADFERIVKDKKGLPDSELLSLIGSYTDEVVLLAVVLTDQNAEFYRELEPLQLLTVMQEVVAHSGDFFMRQIFIPLKQLGAQLSTLGLTAYSLSTKSD